MKASMEKKSWRLRWRRRVGGRTVLASMENMRERRKDGGRGKTVIAREPRFIKGKNVIAPPHS